MSIGYRMPMVSEVERKSRPLSFLLFCLPLAGAVADETNRQLNTL